MLLSDILEGKLTKSLLYLYKLWFIISKHLRFNQPSNPGHCSVLIKVIKILIIVFSLKNFKLFYNKVLSNNTDLYVGHNTWMGYETMLRILKHFKFS